MERFLNTIEANGGTDHEAALRMACSLKPDVIFLLTDGDDPKLTSQQMEKIEIGACGIRMNVIEFGPDAQPDKGKLPQRNLPGESAANTPTWTRQSFPLPKENRELPIALDVFQAKLRANRL